MSKFGELITSKNPVLLDFHTTWNSEHDEMEAVLLDVASALGDKARIIKIDIDKNKELSEALRIKNVPTFIIYKDGEMKWRQSGDQKAETLINRVRDYS